MGACEGEENRKRGATNKPLRTFCCFSYPRKASRDCFLSPNTKRAVRAVLLFLSSLCNTTPQSYILFLLYFKSRVIFCSSHPEARESGRHKIDLSARVKTRLPCSKYLSTSFSFRPKKKKQDTSCHLLYTGKQTRKWSGSWRGRVVIKSHDVVARDNYLIMNDRFVRLVKVNRVL